MSALRFASIGDSLTQGFQHGAIFNPTWSFPAIIARAAGLRVGSTANAEFRVPEILGPGLLTLNEFTTASWAQSRSAS